MNNSTSFDDWFASYLGQNQGEIEKLLNDSLASRFLIGWSLFESKCFNGFVKIDKLSRFAHEIVAEKDFDRQNFVRPGQHFHNRYQNKRLFRNLLHKQKLPAVTDILHSTFNEINDFQLVFMLLVVVYRYRNNMFHGNKGVTSWLGYREQIGLCLEVMQNLISLREASSEYIQESA